MVGYIASASMRRRQFSLALWIAWRFIQVMCQPGEVVLIDMQGVFARKCIRMEYIREGRSPISSIKRNAILGYIRPLIQRDPEQFHDSKYTLCAKENLLAANTYVLPETHERFKYCFLTAVALLYFTTFPLGSRKKVFSIPPPYTTMTDPSALQAIVFEDRVWYVNSFNSSHSLHY